MGRNWYRKKYEHDLILSKHHSPGPFSFVLVLDHLKAGFNVPKIIRAANAFGASELHLINIGMFDPGPAKGTLRQTRCLSYPTFKDSYAALSERGYTFYCLDHRSDETLGGTQFPEKTAFILGHEEYGFSFKREDYPLVRGLRIKQFGQVQSLNVSIAASLACYEWVRQWAADKPGTVLPDPEQPPVRPAYIDRPVDT